MENKRENNAYINILNIEISFTADFDGFLHISAGYCELKLPNNDCVILGDDYTIVKMCSGETVKMKNTLGLKLLEFEHENMS